MDGIKEKSVEQFTLIVEVTVMVLLVVAFILILGWLVCRLVRGARVCCCPVSHPGDLLSELRRRSRMTEFQQRQVIILIFFLFLFFVEKVLSKMFKFERFKF